MTTLIARGFLETKKNMIWFMHKIQLVAIQAGALSQKIHKFFIKSSGTLKVSATVLSLN